MAKAPRNLIISCILWLCSGLFTLAFAEKLQGLWVGYYIQGQKTVKMAMYIYQFGEDVDTFTTGTILDSNIIPGTVRSPVALITNVEFDQDTLSFTKDYLAAGTKSGGVYSRISYSLQLTAKGQLEGYWGGNEENVVYFRRITKSAINNLRKPPQDENVQPVPEEVPAPENENDSPPSSDEPLSDDISTENTP